MATHHRLIYFIDVILPIPLQKAFTYHITEAEAHFLKQGMRVAVPFGKSKIYTALAYKVHNKPPTAYEAKTIHQILDETPVVTENQLKQWGCKFHRLIVGVKPAYDLLICDKTKRIEEL